MSKSAALQSTNSSDFIPSSKTRFETLYSSNDEEDNNKPVWWSSNFKLSSPKLKKTNKNLVQTNIGLDSSKNKNNINEESEKKINDSISLRSIAALLEKAEDNKVFCLN